MHKLLGLFFLFAVQLASAQEIENAIVTPVNKYYDISYSQDFRNYFNRDFYANIKSLDFSSDTLILFPSKTQIDDGNVAYWQFSGNRHCLIVYWKTGGISDPYFAHPVKWKYKKIKDHNYLYIKTRKRKRYEFSPSYRNDTIYSIKLVPMLEN